MKKSNYGLVLAFDELDDIQVIVCVYYIVHDTKQNWDEIEIPDRVCV